MVFKEFCLIGMVENKSIKWYFSVWSVSFRGISIIGGKEYGGDSRGLK